MKKLITTAVLLTIVGLMSGVANAAPVALPDAGTTSSLVLIALGGLTVLRRFVR